MLCGHLHRTTIPTWAGTTVISVPSVAHTIAFDLRPDVFWTGGVALLLGVGALRTGATSDGSGGYAPEVLTPVFAWVPLAVAAGIGVAAFVVAGRALANRKWFEAGTALALGVALTLMTAVGAIAVFNRAPARDTAGGSVRERPRAGCRGGDLQLRGDHLHLRRSRGSLQGSKWYPETDCPSNNSVPPSAAGP